MALPNSPERYGIEISHPDPMMASFGLRSTRRLTNLTSQPTHLRSAAKKRSRGAASVKKRPTWLHAAIEFKRDPFTSGYCYSFKDRTTSAVSEAHAWSDAAHRIDEQHRRTLEKKRVRHRHLATFRAMQRANYGNEFDDDMTINGGMSSSIQYVPATKTGIPVASRVSTLSARKDVANLIGELKSRKTPSSSLLQSTQSTQSTQSMPYTHSTPGRKNTDHDEETKTNTGLRFSDLRKQQHQNQKKKQTYEQEEDEADEALHQLAEARQRLDAMDGKGKNADDKPRVSFQTEEVEKNKEDSRTGSIRKELEIVQDNLKLAETRIKEEVALRVEMEKKLNDRVDETGGEDGATSIPLQDVIEERETRKARFETMLTALEEKHTLEKERAKMMEMKMNEQIAELVKRLKDSEKQILSLTQASREKKRGFDGRETT